VSDHLCIYVMGQVRLGSLAVVVSLCYDNDTRSRLDEWKRVLGGGRVELCDLGLGSLKKSW
jgi:hypothetical protein